MEQHLGAAAPVLPQLLHDHQYKIKSLRHAAHQTTVHNGASGIDSVWTPNTVQCNTLQCSRVNITCRSRLEGHVGALTINCCWAGATQPRQGKRRLHAKLQWDCMTHHPEMQWLTPTCKAAAGAAPCCPGCNASCGIEQATAVNDSMHSC